MELDKFQAPVDVSPAPYVDVVSEITGDTPLHEVIVDAAGRGLWRASGRGLEFAPNVYDGQQRHYCITDSIIRALVERNFVYKPSGLQQRLEYFNKTYGRSLRLIMMRGMHLDFEGHEVMATNKRGLKTVRLIVSNWRQSGNTDTLFDMSDFASTGGTGILFPYDEIDTVSTLILFWQITGIDTELEITVYMGRPIAIDKGCTLIQCEILKCLGSVRPFKLSLPNAEPERSERKEYPIGFPEFDPVVIPLPNDYTENARH